MESIMMWFTGKLELVRRIARQNARIAELRVELELAQYDRDQWELTAKNEENSALWLRDELSNLQEWNDCCTRIMSEAQVQAARAQYHASENDELGWLGDIDPQTEQDYIDQVIQDQVDRYDAEQELLSHARVKHPVRHNRVYKAIKVA